MKNNLFKHPQYILLGIFFLFVVGFIYAPLSVDLYIDQEGFFEFEEYFIDDRYTIEAESFENVHYSNIGLKASGLCTKDENQISGIYGSIAYNFTSETPLTRVVLDITSISESQTNALKIYLNGDLLDMFLGEKTINITEKLEGSTSFSIEVQYWLADCRNEQDLLIQHLKISGTSELPPPDTDNPPSNPSIFNPESEPEPEPDKLYYKLANYIRDHSNPSLQRAAYRSIHGWLHMIKTYTGVVI